MRWKWVTVGSRALTFLGNLKVQNSASSTIRHPPSRSEGSLSRHSATSLQMSQVERRLLISSTDPRTRSAPYLGFELIGGIKQGSGSRQGWRGCVRRCMSSFEHTSHSFEIAHGASMARSMSTLDIEPEVGFMCLRRH